MLLLLVIVVYMAAAIVRIENEGYALATGMCRNAQGLADFACLERTETRTSWWWHLYYALK